MTQPSDLSGRVTELEIQLAHVQRLYEQLNEVVTEQAMQADRRQRELAQLREQIKQLKQKPTEAVDLQDEKPPHY